jgi:transposase-like protein
MRAEAAADFGTSTSTSKHWLAQPDVDDGIEARLTTTEQSKSIPLRRTNWRLEMENEILRRATALSLHRRSQNDIPTSP